MYGLYIDRKSPQSIARQLTGQLRRGILDGSLAAGQALPPTRGLASELSIARNTVIQVYEQLIAEGYLEARTGAGTFVVDLSGRGRARAADVCSGDGGGDNRENCGDGIRFDAGAVDCSRFPRAAWTRALRNACISLPERYFSWNDPYGDEELRQTLSAYLYRAKDIQCGPEQILITPGATGGADILAGALGGAAGRVAVEDPCLHFMREAFRRNGCSLLPVPVDDCGMQVERLAGAQGIGLVYVVPSHQFPTGRVLSVKRRLELLDYARRCGAYIVEDDYDSEFRYEGEPIQSLRNLDPSRVITIGSFSKIFSPTLRIGYMIAPREVLEKARGRMETLNQAMPPLLQRALAAYIGGGLLERHIYSMKRVYARKRLHLIGALGAAFGGSVRIAGDNAGMHLMALFGGRALDERFFARLLHAGVEAEWAEDYALEKGRYTHGMILGYGSLDEPRISEGVRRIRAVWDGWLRADT